MFHVPSPFANLAFEIGSSPTFAAISKTFELAGQQSPLYRWENKYKVSIERLVEGFRREDPPTVPQLAVPVIVPNECFQAGQLSRDPQVETIGCLCLIAYYYLLRVGEYTKPRYAVRNGVRVPATRTKQFRVENVGFFKDDEIIPRSSTLAVLLSCDSATLKITNQKNGRMGDTIHQLATGTNVCPVRALAIRVYHILSKGGSSKTLLCDYHHLGSWYSVTSSEIIKSVRLAARTLQLEKQAIDPDLIGAHSLRAGGAMALKLHGFDDTTIMKMGRWTSLTFLQYIHTQIAHLSKDISRKMSIPLPFFNIAAIE